MPPKTAATLVLGLAFSLIAVAVPAGPAVAMPIAVTERLVIGHSVQGRPIVAYHRYTPGGLGTRPLLVIGQMHGTEETGKRVIAALRQRALPDSVDVWLIPTVNPDGDVRNRRANAHGVDLNRNFPHNWVRKGAGTNYFSGPRAASEPETRAVRDFIRRVQPWRTVSFHTPLYGVDVSNGKDPALARDLSRWSGYPLRSFTCNSGCKGTLTQFINGRLDGAAVTFEFGRSTSSKRVDRVVEAVLRVGTAS